MLLIGPPGTGKTMLAKAIACEAKAQLLQRPWQRFHRGLRGRRRQTRAPAFPPGGETTPAIIFIDEIDCVGKNRKFDTNGEHQQTINALLAAMDGFESSQGIVVVAATNRPEDLDEALLRPGPIRPQSYVPYPDMKGRRAILQTHAAGKPIRRTRTKPWMSLRKPRPGMSGADLANLINEAAILCALQNAPTSAVLNLKQRATRCASAKNENPWC